MPRLIIGLGNPGKEYHNTRHNAGFVVLEELAKAWQFPALAKQTKFRSRVSTGTFNETKIILAEPETYMNESGSAVRLLSDFYKLSPAAILVIHDDKDLPLGEFRLHTDRGPAGHNGIKSIIASLDTQKFTRLRVGIGPAQALPADYELANFVLDNFTAAEQKNLRDLLPELRLTVEQQVKST